MLQRPPIGLCELLQRQHRWVSTATPLRPVGFVRFGDRRIEAVAEHGMIEAGTAVTVAESGPARIVVRARG